MQAGRDQMVVIKKGAPANQGTPNMQFQINFINPTSAQQQPLQG